MKLTKTIAAIIAVMSACSSPAYAGQGFFVTFDSSASSSFPTTAIGNINYKDWYPNDISAGRSVSGGGTSKIYTENCSAFFGCGSASGDRSLFNDGVLWSLVSGSTPIVNFCISNNGPISTTCGVQSGGGSQLTYNNWLAGCYVPNGGYTCAVTSMGQSGDQIAITYTLGLPASKKAE